MDRVVVLRMFSEHGGGCLWDERGGTCLAAHFPETPEQEALEDRMWEWNNWYHKVEPGEVTHEFDWQAYYNHGLDIARDIKKLYGDAIQIKFEKNYEDPNATLFEFILI